MIDIDIKSYTDLYLQTAREEINLIRSSINQNNPDLKTLHRTSHSLKGQSYFMKFDEIGDKAKELEDYFRTVADRNLGISEEDKIYINSKVEEIEKLIIAKNNLS